MDAKRAARHDTSRHSGDTNLSDIPLPCFGGVSIGSNEGQTLYAKPSRRRDELRPGNQLRPDMRFPPSLYRLAVSGTGGSYRESGTREALHTRKRRSDKQSNDEAVKSAVFALLHSPPSAHGVNRTTWTIADLQKDIVSKASITAGGESIRTVIKESGFKWRHARIVLTSNDPDYKAKVEAITKILSVLKPDEAFFSVDEYGPFAIKVKGGKKRVAPGEQYVVPQWQKSKGWMILTAALELSRNQVTHFYSRKKNTAEMIKMADTLRNQYRTCSTIYLSWDAASWHVSKDLVEHLEEINQQAVVDEL
jgi:hypothetical protein